MSNSLRLNPFVRMDSGSANPFSRIPVPTPLEGLNHRAPDIFQFQRLMSHLELNAAWIKALPRTTRQIEAALFPSYCLGGMKFVEVWEQMNHALWEAGYTPSSVVSDDPTWTWTEDN